MEPLARGANVVAALRANLDTSLSMSMFTRTSGSSAGAQPRVDWGVTWCARTGARAHLMRCGGWRLECGCPWPTCSCSSTHGRVLGPHPQHLALTTHLSAWPPPRRAPPPRPAGAGGAAAPPRARGPPQTAGSGRTEESPAAAEPMPGAAGRLQPCCRRARAPFWLWATGTLQAAAGNCRGTAQCFKRLDGCAFPASPSSPPGLHGAHCSRVWVIFRVLHVLPLRLCRLQAVQAPLQAFRNPHVLTRSCQRDRC